MLTLLNHFFFPEFCAIVFALFSVLCSLFFRCFAKNTIYIFALFALGLSYCNYSFTHISEIIMNGLYIHDKLSVLLKSFLYGAFGVGMFLFHKNEEIEQKNHFEYIMISLFMVIGAVCATAANDLIAFYVAIEMQSLALCVLITMQRKNINQALKLFILSAVSSAILIYGISLIYNIVGYTNFYNIIHFTTFDRQFTFGISFLLIGLFFKLAMFPLHIWAPDIYEKSSFATLFWLTIVSKISVIIPLYRLLHNLVDYGKIALIIKFFAIFSMIFGAVGGIMQQNFKRLLVFSGMVNFGLLLGLISMKNNGITELITYLLLYTLNVMGILFTMKSCENEIKTIDDFKGFFQKAPQKAFLLTFYLLSLAGIPPFLGFFAKFSALRVFLYDFNSHILLISFIISSVIAMYFYIRPILYMIMITDIQHIQDVGDKRNLALFFAFLLFVISVILIFNINILDNYIIL